MAAALVDSRSDQSRRAILNAARPVFAREGFAAASLNQIIEASGLTKGGFYFHFPSKEALALAVLADHEQRIVNQVLDEVSAFPTAFERLFATPRIFARLAADGQSPTTFAKLIEELARDADLRDEVCGGLKRWIETVTGQFRDAQVEGSIRADIDAADFAALVIGCYSGLQLLSDQLNDGKFADRLEQLIDVVQAALATPKRRLSK